jgi:hypothetical protein
MEDGVQLTQLTGPVERILMKDGVQLVEVQNPHSDLRGLLSIIAERILMKEQLKHQSSPVNSCC